jgi:rubredoxin
MKVYQCVACDHYYTEKATTSEGVSFDQVPAMMVCQRPECDGEGLTGLCIPVEESLVDIARKIGSGDTKVITAVATTKRELGLCVFLMDASGSMGENAFGDYSQPADPAFNMSHPNNSPVEKAGNMSKRIMVAAAAASGIFGLRKINEDQHDNVYVCVILYDHDTKYLFFKSIKTILREYTDAKAFASYLLQELKGMNGGTDINKALGVAHSLVDRFKEGKVDALGSFYPVTHNVPHEYDVSTGQAITPKRTLTNIPNIRVLLYTDGEHQPERGVLDTPFNQFVPDPLIGAYIGQPGTNGERELQSLVHKCPIHGKDQFLVVHKPEDMMSLHGIFRMASGQSGYCLDCLKTIQKNVRVSDY